ncbi:MAG: KTSC domain-containing protein [Bacteroidota bacterium]
MPSSVVADMHYDEEKKELTIVYVSGSVYVYKSVPKNIYISLRAARSKGKYLNEVIKGSFKFESK